MTVIVGSTNPVKIKAVANAFTEHRIDALIKGMAVPSGVSKQPFSLEELIVGARARAAIAKSSQPDCDLGFGLESGIYLVSNTYFNTCAVAIHDGEAFYEALSPSFAIPTHLAEQLKKGGELNDFWSGRGIGAIGHFTNGVRTREQQLTEAAVIALGQYVKREEYQKR